ncbi:hypothetical protein HYS49_03980 [Candidatus Woesearchaeota archaeon]|nr:hypothetical protein [Candidatus Woesearchaeota archaeon]
MVLPESLTLPIIIGAALVDSINPCVFGVLIFLIAFMTKVYKKPGRMLLGGAFYTMVVYVTYFLLGLGILRFTVSFGLSLIVYWFAALIAIGAGLLEIKDFFWYGKGPTLQLLPGAAERLKKYTRKIERLQEHNGWFTYVAAGLLGVFVVIVELPCTGAPYLAILAIIGQANYAQGIPLLLLYNFIFILPLLAIIAASYFGKSSQAMEQWRKKHRGVMRLAIGLFLIALGILMIATVS